MHPNQYARRPLCWGLILAAGVFTSVAQGQPLPPIPPVAGTAKIDPKTGAVIVPLGGLVTFDGKLPDIPTDIVVTREDIVQVRIDPANPKILLLTGRQPGLTQITLTFMGKPKMVFDVIIQPDLEILRLMIRRTVPTAAVDVQPGIGNVIVLSGYVTSPQDADIVARLATSAVGNVNNVINAVQVGGGQQVQIDVVIASVDRNMLRSRGFDWALGGANANFQSIVSGLLTNPLGTVPATFTSDANLQLGVVTGSTKFFAALRALRSEGVAKFLGEPRVVTQTGRAAFFRAGGQQAIVSGTSGITGPGVQLVPFGTELEVLPIVYGNGMIWLEINPRISAVSQGLGITIGGTTSPGFTEQQVRAAVMLESGQTYAIGGLIQNSVQASATKVPVLGDLPFLGIGFSRVSHQQQESELVILVTPRLVGPLNCDQVPRRLPGMETRNPDDYELFLENILEAPRGQRKVWNGRCYNAAYKCGPTAAIFPCVGGVCTGQGGPAPGAAGGCGAAGCGVSGASGLIGPGAMTGPGGVGPLSGHPSVVVPVSPPGALPPIGSIPSGPVGPGPLLPIPPAGGAGAGSAGGPQMPVAPAAPTTPPAVPGSPVSETKGNGAPTEPAPLSLPAVPPPVVVVPEIPRN